MRIAITGANGQLGSELARFYGRKCECLSRPEFDLGKPSSIAATLLNVRPDVLINTAAFTAVDKAETDGNECFQVNAQSVEALSDICHEIDCTLVQISTDYVFGGDRNRSTPYTETDQPRPQGIYAKSKLAGERFAAEHHKHFIIRTCGLYAPAGPQLRMGRNFVETMLLLGRERSELSVVADQLCTPTYIPELVSAIDFLISTKEYGTYHVTNTGETTWLEFARAIFDVSGIDMTLLPITTKQYNAPASRPNYSVLCTDKYHRLGGPAMSPWQDALRQHVGSLHVTPATR